MFEICSDLFKRGLEIYYFCQHSKKAKKWPNGQTILFLANSFKKGQMATLPSQVSLECLIMLIDYVFSVVRFEFQFKQ